MISHSTVWGFGVRLIPRPYACMTCLAALPRPNLLNILYAHRNNSTCASGYYIDTHVVAVVADMNNHGHLDIVFGHGEQKQEPKLAIAG